MINWLKNRMVALALATSKVEKSALNNDGSMLSDDVGVTVNHKKGYLSDDLMKGILSQEVKELRWRMYKVLDEAENRNKIIIGYKDAVDPETGEIYQEPIMGDALDSKYRLNKVKTDDFDDYPLDMLINNSDVSGSMTDRAKGEITTLEKKLEFEFYDLPRFNIREYVIKMIVRKINDEEFLGEIYFSKYHDGYSPTHALFIKDIEKCYQRKKVDYLFDLKTIGFITNDKDLGVKANKGFLFNVTSFDKIIEFDGYYVVKYKMNKEFYDHNIFDKYYDDDLGEKYKNKSPRNKDANY